MGYRNLRQCVTDLERGGRLLRITDEVDPDLEAAEIHRRVYRHQGPALLFEQVRGCGFPLVSNLFGTAERVRYMFRDTWEAVRQLIALKTHPEQAVKRPWRLWKAPLTLLHMAPRTRRRGAVMERATQLSQLPQVRCWPRDGGAFVTLPMVYSEDADQPGPWKSNLGMYRVQLSGNRYQPDHQVGLHYQIHRGIGVQHQQWRARGLPFPVNILVGGTPAMMLAAVMPLPEGMSELTFAGALAGHRIPLVRQGGDFGPAVYAEADFCIRGTVGDALLPEGPFGDHLGYYSLEHAFPVLQVRSVHHRRDAIWPFTVVGRPPQEDTTFGEVIHELTGPVIPSVLPGVQAVHAVNAAGVHPLLLALGSERYTPYLPLQRPQELLTQANAILGQGQLSLAKYLWIAAVNDDPHLQVHHIGEFFQHMLKRVDWRRDLHFQTQTTMDTLDYSSGQFNAGSKLVVAAAGPAVRALPPAPPDTAPLPAGFAKLRQCLPGVLAVQGPAHRGPQDQELHRLRSWLELGDLLADYPLLILVDDVDFTAANLDNFLWVTFTRSDPARDIDGPKAAVRDKHWGCACPLLIDARSKPHHAPPLETDPAVDARVDARAARGGPLAQYL